MNNVELFNIYASKLLVALYDNFPVPIVINAEAYVGEVVPSPDSEPDEDCLEAERDKWMESCSIYEGYRQRSQVFSATVAFLQSERLIRFLHPRNMSVGTDITPDDILIERATAVGSKQRLNFVLTAHGLAQLSKTVTGGKLMDDTLIAKLKETLSSEAVKATPNIALTTVVPWLFSRFGG